VTLKPTPNGDCFGNFPDKIVKECKQCLLGVLAPEGFNHSPCVQLLTAITNIMNDADGDKLERIREVRKLAAQDEDRRMQDRHPK
jgi:hypothetical protein